MGSRCPSIVYIQRLSRKNMMNKRFVQYLSFLLLMNIECSSLDWNYHNRGPDTWADDYPSCSGQYQSPINILTACTEYRRYAPFEFTSDYNRPHRFILKNIGSTISGTIDELNDASSIRLSGGGLNGTFDFLNFHLHWGKNYRSGSEHHINGRKYAGEIHFVHINRQTGQLAVLGMFMESYSKKHPIHQHENDSTRNEWRKYLSIAKKLREENTSTIFDLNLSALIGENLNDFWRYEGSLTTPPCTEGVLWTVFRQPRIFIEEQMEKLRENILLEGHRPPQPLYNRIVYRNHIDESFSPIPDYNLCQVEWSHFLSSISSLLFIFTMILFGMFSVKFVFNTEQNKNHG